jgi:hypothetical protein
MGAKPTVGDVFLIPLKGGGYAGGQVISAWHDELYIAVFDQRLGADENDPLVATSSTPMFLTLTLDAKLWHGDWPTIGNRQDNLHTFPQPAYKVRQAGVTYVESRDRTVSRPASPAEASVLRYRTVSSPAVIEEAVVANFGGGAWDPLFNDLRSDYAASSSRVL